MAVSLACPDWAAKLRAGETPIAQIPLDAEKADRAVRIFNELRLPDVPGHPPLREASGEWFRDIVRAAFGSHDPETGLPAVNELFVLVPKKNSKTTNAAALGLVGLIMCERPAAQMLILGPTQNVAERCFDQAHGMIKADPMLRKIFHVQSHLKEITRIKTGAKLSVKTFDMNVVTGEIPALTIIDELHVVAGKSYADRVIAQVTGGMVTNPEALLVYITTQSDIEPSGVFKTKLDYARGVRDGIITDRVRLLPVLYEFPPEVQAAESQPWRDVAMWPMVLPNLGRSVHLELLRDKYAQAMQEGPQAERIWASQHLNIQIGLGLSGDYWPGALYWQAAADKGLTLERIMAECDVCVAGVDGGGLDDLFALAVIGRHAKTRRWMVWARAWAQPEVFERRKEIAARLRDFEKDGDLVVCSRVDQDAEDCADICARLAGAGLLPARAAIGLDAYGVASLIDALAERGLDGDRVMAVGQGYKLQSAITTLPRKLKDRTLRHGGQPIMSWVVGNAKQELRGSNYVVTKQAAGSAKIDPLMAMFNAAMLMFLNPVADVPPVVRVRVA